jgi:hypothetical protein
MRPLFTLSFEDVATTIPESPALRGKFCVAKSSAPHSALKHSLDWACGPGSANCSAVQPGQSCYKSDDIVAVSSYVFNDYYHRTQSSGGTCNFNGTAMITSTDPSKFHFSLVCRNYLTRLPVNTLVDNISSYPFSLSIKLTFQKTKFSTDFHQGNHCA